MAESEVILTAPISGSIEQDFADIYKEHYRIVYFVSLKMSGSIDEAEEITQEAFMKLYEKWPSLRINTSIRAWLVKVATNISNSRYRRGKSKNRMIETLRAGDPVSLESTEDTVIKFGDQRLVSEVLGRLKRRDRTTLISRYSGLSYQEISNVIGVKVSSVGKILERAETRFRNNYKALDKGD